MSHPIDHIGIACTDLALACKAYTQAFGLIPSAAEDLLDLGVRVQFINTPNTRIELLEPTNSDGPLARFLNKHGPGLHHICFEVKDIIDSMKELTRQGYQLIDEHPRKGAEGALVAFLKPASFNGVLTELAQKCT